jgi:hypothetical protein
MSNVEHLYSIADSHAQTVQVCIDRLYQLGAKEQLQLLTGRLQKLAAAPPKYPMVGSFVGCCARAASGHAAAAPPSVAKNFRRSMWLAM